jgi:hypothetical protein
MPVRPIDRGQRPWNKGLLIGQKKPLEPKHVWSIRVTARYVRQVGRDAKSTLVPGRWMLGLGISISETDKVTWNLRF